MAILVPVPLMAGEIVTAQGWVPLVSHPETALEHATLMALDNACRSSGIILESESIVDLGVLIDDFIRTKTNAYVLDHEVLRQWRQDGCQYVEVKAHVKQGAQRMEADKTMLSSHIVALLSREEFPTCTGQLLSEKLEDFGLSVLSEDLLCHKIFANRVDISCSGHDISFTEIQRFLASAMVTVKTDVQLMDESGPIKGYRASAIITCVDVTDGRRLYSSRVSGRIYGRDRSQAITGGRKDQFRAVIAEPVISDFLAKSGKHFNKRTRYICMDIADVSSRQALDEIRDTLLRLSWVTDVKNESYDRRTSRLRVEYAEQTVYLAAMLEIRKRLKVDSFGWDWMKAHYNP